MGYKPKPLGYKALGTLESVQSHLKNIEKATAEAQQAVIENKPLIAMKIMSDIRTQSMLGHSLIVQAKAGEFEE